MRKVLFTLVFSALLLPQAAGAIGLAVKPSKLELSQVIAGRVETQFLVSNSTDQSALYQVFADQQQGNITLDPTEFRLDAGESRLITLESHFLLPARYRFDISIVARPLEASSIRTASGVKIPLTVHILPSWPQVAIGAFLLSCLIVVFALQLRNKPSSQAYASDK